MSAIDPALGLIELESLARGLVVADALIKRASVRVTHAEAMTPGKFLLLYVGGVAEVSESHSAALEAAGRTVIDQLFLPHLAEAVVAAIEGKQTLPTAAEAVGIVELNTVAATVRAADVAVKRAQVTLRTMQLARGIGGKGWFTLSGNQHDVEAALEGAVASAAEGMLVASELIQRPHVELIGSVLPGLLPGSRANRLP